MPRLNLTAALTVTASLLLASIPLGCASIITGSMQDVSFISNPTGAYISVDGMDMGDTPAVVKLSRKSEHTVQVSMSGYRPYEVVLGRGVNGWLWGNILFGGLIGVAIDAATGAMYKLNPNHVNAELIPESNAISSVEDDALVIRIVLKPDPSWEQIGCLVPIGQ